MATEFRSMGPARQRWASFGAALAIVLGSHAAAQDDALLFPPAPLALGSGFGAMASADLDGDGVGDLVFGRPGTDDASIFLGAADLTLTPAGVVPLGDDPSAIALADVDGDGRPDLVAANAGSDDVSVHLGLGDGSFAGGEVHPVGDQPTDVAVADVDADGLLDLVVVNYAGSDVSVLIGLGGGAFAPASSQPVGPELRRISLGDVDQDDLVDLAAITGTGVFLLTGHGDGSFAPAGSAVLGGFTGTGVLLHDVNVDGHLDIVANPQARLVVALGDGSGAFAAPEVVADGFFGAEQLLPHDVDGDGLADVLAIDGWTSRVMVLPAHGGSLSVLSTLPVRPGAVAAVPIDLSADPVAEIAVLNSVDDSVSLLFGLHGPAIGSRQVYEMVGYLRSLAIGDLDNDGLDDVLLGWLGVPVFQPNGLAVMRGLGHGLLASAQVIPNNPISKAVHHLALGDLDGDGVLDLAQLKTALNLPYGGDLTIRVGLGNFAFAPAVALPSGPDISDLVIADLDLDGAQDLVLADLPLGAIAVMWGDGTGQFPTTDSFSTGASVAALAVGDINRDGLTDLVAATGAGATDAALVLFATAPRQFDSAQVLAAGFGPGRDVALADLDGDEFLDVVAGVATGFVLVPCPGGSPAVPTAVLGVLPQVRSIAVGDIGGDGVPDIVLVDPEPTFLPTGKIAILCGRGDGTFLTPQIVPTLNGATHVGLGAFDASGGLGLVAIDRVTSNYFDNSLIVLLNGREPTWKKLGGSLSGSAGVPLLRGEGEPTAGHLITLSLSRARPSSLAAIVIGISTLNAPFKGGLMVPSLSVLIPGLPTNGAGQLVLSGTWPPGLPPGLTTYFQYWIVDPAGPAGFAASNALSGTTP